MRRRVGTVFAGRVDRQEMEWELACGVSRTFPGAAKGEQELLKSGRGLNGGVRDTWGRAAGDVMRQPLGASSAADAGADADDPTNPAALGAGIQGLCFRAEGLRRSPALVIKYIGRECELT